MSNKERVKEFFSRCLSSYLNNRIPLASAGLAYYFTMTFFPVVICLYTLLGNNYDLAMRAIEYVSDFLPGETIKYLTTFMGYVFENYSVLMMLFAFSVIIITASAAFRSLENTIGEMQGGRRYDGYAFFLVSIVISLLAIVLLYVAIVFLFMTEDILNAIYVKIPQVDLQSSWRPLRFLLTSGVTFLLLILIYEFCKRSSDRYSTFYGALTATLILLGISYVFSVFINISVKYPLVYSSLSAIILLMFWLYCSSIAIYTGAIVNVTLRDMKMEKAESE